MLNAIMLSVTNKPLMLTVIMLNVIMLGVVVPSFAFKESQPTNDRKIIVR
jgi:hypothetical protein